MSDLPADLVPVDAASSQKVAALPPDIVTVPKDTAPIGPTVAAPKKPTLTSIADDVLSYSPIYSLTKNIGPPLYNTLVADPVRNLAADVVGAVRSPPISEGGREGFWEERDKSLEGTSGLRLPQTESGDRLAAALGIPGQAIGAVAGGIGDLTGTRETLGPAATIAGDVLPFAGGAATAMRRRTIPGASAATPAAVSARSAGYRLPPEEISESPSATSRLLSGDSGKIKKNQSFSVDNQKNTNALAAKAVGLKPGTMLTEAAYETAKKPAIEAYDAVKTGTPETVLSADPAFRSAVEGVGIRNAEMERAFPEAVPNPHVADLKATLLRNPITSTDAVMKKIADLRADAGRNFRKENDPQMHQLGLAQRQAANVLEDAIERSIGYGPERTAAFAKVSEATQAVENAKAVLAGQRNVQTIGMPAAQAALAAAEADLKAKMGTLTPADTAAAQATIKKFQNARQLFAKIYDLEDATNLANGDVLARRVSALRRTRDRPLTGEMKSIADAYDSFTRNMQSPAAFGGVEAFSILDLVAGATAVGAGHPLAGGIIAGRYPARSLLRSDWMQNRMFNRPTHGANPNTAVPAAALAMPHEDDGLSRAFEYQR